MQDGVDGVERVRHAEIELEDPTHVRAPQRGHAVLGRRAASHPLDESRLLLGRHPTGAAGRRVAMHGTEPAVAIGVDPPLNEAAAPPEPCGDLERLVAFEGEGDASQPVALHRVAFGLDHPAQPLPVAGLPFLHVHAASLPEEDESCAESRAGATRTGA